MYFPSNFSVCGAGLVRNSADELFVEGTSNVSGVDVCVVFESHTVYSVPVGACVFPVVPWFFYVFPPDFGLVCAYEGGDLFV